MSAVIFIFRKTLIFTAKWSLCNLKCRKLPGCIVTNDKGGVANDIEINAGIQLGPNYQHYGLVLADWHLDMDPPHQFSYDGGQLPAAGGQFHIIEMNHSALSNLSTWEVGDRFEVSTMPHLSPASCQCLEGDSRPARQQPVGYEVGGGWPGW